MKPRIKVLRWQHQLTMEQLAKKVGVSRVSVWNWEHGTCLPNAARLLQLADVLGVPVEELYEKEE